MYNHLMLLLSLLVIITSSMIHNAKSMDERLAWDINQQLRWPHLYAVEVEEDKARQDPELLKILQYECPVGESIPYEQVQLTLSKLPFHTGGFYIESKLELIRLFSRDQSEELSDIIKRSIEPYHTAYRNDYYQRFPEDEENSFDKAMQPFNDFCKEFIEQNYLGKGEEVANDKFEIAWTLLDKALKK
jgi:hypothetical protein